MALSNPTKLTGHVRVSEAELREHHENLTSKRVTDIPSDLQIRIEYNGDGTQKYVGYAPKGHSTGDDGWLLWEFTYNGSKQMTLRQSAFDTWDNRASASFE